MWNSLITGSLSLRAAVSADQPSGPSVTTCTTSGRCSDQRLSSTFCAGRPSCRLAYLGIGMPRAKHLLHAIAAAEDARRPRGLARTDQIHPVPGRRQPLDDAPGAHRHPVDFRRMGFGHHGHRRGVSGLTISWQTSPAIHPASVAGRCCKGCYGPVMAG